MSRALIFENILNNSFLVFLILSAFFLTTPISAYCDSGLNIDLFNQHGGQGPNQSSADFMILDTVFLTSNLTYNGVGIENKIVGFEVRNSAGELILDRTGLTDENGIVTINFTIGAEDCSSGTFGIWTAFTFAEVSQQIVNDTLTFDVSGPYIDVYTQKPDPYNGKGLHQPSDMFSHQEEVILFAEVHFDCQPIENKFVVFEVRDPEGQIVIDRVSSTDEYGIANTSFRIESTPIFGIYHVLALVEISEQVANDTLSFNVDWVIELQNIESVDEDGYTKGTFVRGEQIFFNITAINNAWVPKTVTFTISIYDEASVPIGQVGIPNILVSPGQIQAFLVGIQLPTWSYVGVGTFFANAYTNLLQEIVIPWCPENNSTFLIEP